MYLHIFTCIYCHTFEKYSHKHKQKLLMNCVWGHENQKTQKHTDDRFSTKLVFNLSPKTQTVNKLVINLSWPEKPRQN